MLDLRPEKKKGSWEPTYSLCNIVDDNSAVRISVVHRGQRFVSLLTSCVPYFELDGCVLIQRNGLCQEGGADRRLSVVIKLVLRTVRFAAQALQGSNSGIYSLSQIVGLKNSAVARDISIPGGDVITTCRRCLLPFRQQTLL